MIKLIAFDLWSTLATRTNPKYHFSEELKKSFNLDISTNKIIDIFESIVQTKYWETEVDAHIEFAKKINIEINKENILKIISIRAKAENNIKLYDFTINLLKQLKKQKYKIALITNSSRFIYDIVKQNTNILNYIDYPIFSFMVGTVKPDPKIFLEATKRSGFKNNEIIMIGDTYSKDVEAPKKLGFNAIHFTGEYNKLKKDLKEFNIIVE